MVDRFDAMEDDSANIQEKIDRIKKNHPEVDKLPEDLEWEYPEDDNED